MDFRAGGLHIAQVDAVAGKDDIHQTEFNANTQIPFANLLSVRILRTKRLVFPKAVHVVEHPQARAVTRFSDMESRGEGEIRAHWSPLYSGKLHAMRSAYLHQLAFSRCGRVEGRRHVHIVSQLRVELCF